MNKISLIIGATMGLLATFLTYQYTANLAADSIAAPFLLLDSRHSLVKGDTVEEQYLLTQALPSRFQSLSRLAIADSTENREWIIGRSVTRDVPAGSLLMHEYFLDDPANRFASQITIGKRAFTIPTNSTASVAYFIEPGSRVDVAGTFTIDKKSQKGEGKPLSTNVIRVTETRSILQNLKVLAVDQATTRKSYLQTSGRGFSTITLEVAPLEAETLIFAQNESRSPLSFVLRNPSDTEVKALPSISWRALAGEK